MNQLQSFAQYCVKYYAKRKDHYDEYALKVNEIPDFVKHEFASIIMSHDEAYAVEATGPDNKHWNKKMLPTLTKYLSNSADKDAAVEFNNTWRDCVADYMTAYMQRLINDALYEFNNEHGCIRPASYHYGVSAHGPI